MRHERISGLARTTRRTILDIASRSACIPSAQFSGCPATTTIGNVFRITVASSPTCGTVDLVGKQLEPFDGNRFLTSLATLHFKPAVTLIFPLVGGSVECRLAALVAIPRR
jgi:hypothetical protein